MATVKKVKIAIIGAGTAGLSALKEVTRYTQDVVIIDAGPLGTTCARTGCMPSKALIQIANDFYRRHALAVCGIEGTQHLTLSIQKAMRHVQHLRDYYVRSVLDSVKQYQSLFILSHAELLEPTTIKTEKMEIKAEKVIIATGSRPFIPVEWEKFKSQLLTSENLFEQLDFSSPLPVIGAGEIGTELAQALHRLGIQTHLFGNSQFMGGLTDPVINLYAIKILNKELPLVLGVPAEIAHEQGKMEVTAGEYSLLSDQVFVSIGRQPNSEALKLDNLNVLLNEKGLPPVNPYTMQVKDLPVFIAGDGNGERPLLHEAIDEGRIAGFNALQTTPCTFKRRIPLQIAFTQPNIALVGTPFNSLQGKVDFVCGEVSFEDQGRARIMQKNDGYLRLYAHQKEGTLLGAEMIAPGGEYLAHLLALAIHKNLTVFDLLQCPFYHPTLEEGLRTALQDAASKIKNTHSESELALCEGSAAQGLN